MRRSTSIDALIKLIDDPDLGVFEQVRSELLRNGQEVVPQLYDLIDYDKLNTEHLSRIDALIKEFQFNVALEEITKWCTSSEKDLLQGLHIISSIQFPDLTIEKLNNQILNIQRRIWLEVNRKLTAFENVERMNQMWFRNIGLQVVDNKNATPFNTFINTVMEDLCGTPLSTGLIYSIVAQRLNLPIYGVNFPNQFVLAYMDEYRIHHLIEPLGTGGVLFYVLPKEKGRVVIKKHLDAFLLEQHSDSSRECFEPCSHSSLLILYLDELVEVYNRLDREDDVSKYMEIKSKILELA